jgi:hypothetical protein
LSDNALVRVDFDGMLLTKAEFLSRAKSGNLQQGITPSRTVPWFGDTAIVTGIYPSSEVNDGKTLLRHGRFVYPWVYKDSPGGFGGAAQATPIVR